PWWTRSRCVRGNGSRSTETRAGAAVHRAPYRTAVVPGRRPSWMCEAGSGAVARVRVDLVRLAAQHVGDLLDDDDPHEVGEVRGVDRARLDRPSVDDDRRVEPRLGGEEAPEWHAAVLPRCGVRGRDVLDREARAVQLGAPARLEALDR